MSRFAIIRLGKDSVADIKELDQLTSSPVNAVSFDIKCAQVPSDLTTGDFAFVCLGSDNNKGIVTAWRRGVRALGTITKKTGGPGYNDQWTVGIEIKVVLPDSVNQKDLLAKAPQAYYWCSEIPVLGVDSHSNQTIQLLKDGETHQSVPSLAVALASIYPSFATDTKASYPQLSSLFDYEPPAAGGGGGASAGGPPSASIPAKPRPTKPDHNTIFFGPPGTGKSFRAQQTADSQSAVVVRTLFHPESTYSEFVGAYKPVVGYHEGGEQIKGFDGEPIGKPHSYFAYSPGPLMKAVKLAYETPKQTVVLMIEEINRGDCGAIFGDIFQLLDRGSDGTSEYGVHIAPEVVAFLGEEFVKEGEQKEPQLRLPGNLFIYATMNTSDQSLHRMDAAFKRRWNWVACPVNFSEVITYCKTANLQLTDGKRKFDWRNLIDAINRKIALRRMEDKQIGPWFIKPDRQGVIDFEAFRNKCLFYLWHDVFRDSQDDPESPFRDDIQLNTFHELQEALDSGGIEAVLKDEILEVATLPS